MTPRKYVWRRSPTELFDNEVRVYEYGTDNMIFKAGAFDEELLLHMIADANLGSMVRPELEKRGKVRRSVGDLLRGLLGRLEDGLVGMGENT